MLAGQARFVGDPEYWYALYHYFAEGLYNNTLALWNPYMNGGEPFWPTFGMFRLIDPLNVLLILVGRVFGLSIFYLYHIQFLLKVAVSLVGCYAVFRYFTASLLASLFASSILAGYWFRVLAYDAQYMAFSWVPWILLFLIRFFDQGKARDFLLMTYVMGLYVGAASYHMVYGLVFLLLFVVAWCVAHPATVVQRCRTLWQHQRKALLITIVLAGMTLPAIITFLSAAHHLYPIARTAGNRDLFERAAGIGALIGTTHDPAEGGSQISPEEMKEMISRYPFPPGDRIFLRHHIFTILVGAVFAIGLTSGRRGLICLVVGVVMASLAMGDHLPVFALSSSALPPLRLLRQLSVFFPFVIFAASIIVALGLRRLIQITPALYAGAALMQALWLVDLATSSPFFTGPAYEASYYADFPHEAQTFRFPGSRALAIPRTGFYLLEPVLYKTNTALQMVAVPPAGYRREDLPYFRKWDSFRAKDRFGAAIGTRTIFWTRPYYRIYRMGEGDLRAFETLMGVGEFPVTFWDNALTVPDEDVWRLIAEKGGVGLQALVGRHENLILASEHVRQVDGVLSSKAFEYEIVNYTPTAVTMAISASRSGYLLWWDGYDEDWTATVDGKRQAVYRAMIGSKALYIHPGTHDIHFVYRPSLFLASLYIYWGLCVLVPVLIIALKPDSSSESAHSAVPN